MKKKFDIKSTLNLPARELTPEHIELATRQVHEKQAAQKAEKKQAQPKPDKPKAAPADRSTAPKTPKPPQKTQPKAPRPAAAALVAAPKLLPVLPPKSLRAAVQQPRILGRIGRRIVTDDPSKKVRLSIDVRPEVHKKLKIKAIENDSDIMRYVEALIERDLGMAG